MKERQLLEDIFDGALTDYESTDGDDGVDSDALSTDDGPMGSLRPLHQGAGIDQLASDASSLPQGDSQATEAATVPNAASSEWKKGRSMSAHRRAKKLAYSHRQQAAKRATKQAEKGTDLKEVAMKRRREAARQVIQVDFSLLNDAPVSLPGYVGKRMMDMPRETITLERLLESGATHFTWDGRWAPLTVLSEKKLTMACRQTYPLLDTEGYVLGLLLGQPREGWDQTHDAAFGLLKKEAAYFKARRSRKHRRGTFPSVAHGISYGGGQEVRLSRLPDCA